MDRNQTRVLLLLAMVFLSVNVTLGQVQELKQIFSKCHKKSSDFDECMKGALNEVTKYYKTGIPELNIAPFDPHRAAYIEQRRGISDSAIGGYRLVLTDVSEYEWSNSVITKYRSDPENNRFLYTQDFPQKYLDGHYDFRATVFGNNMHTKGHFNVSLFDYTQTTSVRRVGGPGSALKVRIEIDTVRDMKLKISDIFNGSRAIENTADYFINNFWKTGFPFVKPLINDLISTAFTDIYNESFRNLDIDQFIMD